jgi:hypothetical protein
MFEITVRDCSKKDKKSITYVTSNFMLCIVSEKDTFATLSGGEIKSAELVKLCASIQCEINNINTHNCQKSYGEEVARNAIEKMFLLSEGTQQDFEWFINSMEALGTVHGPGEL